MLDLLIGDRARLQVLCLGAHCDDIEIGCGGTLLHLLGRRPETTVRWVVFSSGGERKKEGLKSAQAFLKDAASSQITINDFRDSYFPYIGAQIKDYFESEIRQCSPDLIFTHTGHDLHQDHRLISELTWNTFRNHMILEYEIPKYDGDLGRPNLFVPLEESICRRKVDTILDCYASQRGRGWFNEGTFMSLLRLRGVEAGVGDGFAEGFVARKLRLQSSAPGEE
jgi:LmbE family N-acetylglucosaminyl deacetylase